ncbi:PEPxxWA-CTERM sorting domain-containing protein [Phenylobacterium sp.]|uniref:PEPxxWA-CTERM sorting domain-containing protein n=1 Tax=Phenylobacterium sp. TaxID=1871053 RepID=UPI0025D2A7AC|nr:PEPxxWA-CTERM sorting domain-containing protein [Phenylobacterium sp.]
MIIVAAAMAVASSAGAATFTFDEDPFAGSTALTTPGRQIVGGEPFLVFDPTADEILIAPAVFGVTPPILAFNGLAADLTAGFNLVVLRDLDADPVAAGNQMAAGLAANLIADAVTVDGAGFFFYFNSGLDLVRLVYSTNLSDNTADLKVLARFTNLSGAAGAAAMAEIGPQVSAVPEPAVWGMMLAGFGLAGSALRRRRHAVRYRI